MTVRTRFRFMADFMTAGTRHRELFDTAEAAEAWELAARSALKLGQPVPKRQADSVREPWRRRWRRLKCCIGI